MQSCVLVSQAWINNVTSLFQTSANFIVVFALRVNAKFAFILVSEVKSKAWAEDQRMKEVD